MGRHDQRRQLEDESRYRLRAGMAADALRHKLQRPSRDVRGQPLESAEMAERHNTKTLERWSKGSRKIIVSL